jgi:hypothetical protein
MLTLAEIKQEIDRLAAQVGASGYLLPTYGSTDDGARPHIEIDSREYHYVVVERGQELKRISTEDVNELLFHVFVNVAFNLAVDYEVKHRIEGQDCRRLGFRRQIELLSALSKDWSDREARTHEQILGEYPFDDLASIRAQLSKQVGWKVACEKYPLPDKPKDSSK